MNAALTEYDVRLKDIYGHLRANIQKHLTASSTQQLSIVNCQLSIV